MYNIFYHEQRVQCMYRPKTKHVILFHKKSKDEDAIVIYEGTSPGAYNYITPNIGNRIEGCCGKPTMYENCVLSKMGEDKLNSLS